MHAKRAIKDAARYASSLRAPDPVNMTAERARTAKENGFRGIGGSRNGRARTAEFRRWPTRSTRATQDCRPRNAIVYRVFVSKVDEYPHVISHCEQSCS